MKRPAPICLLLVLLIATTAWAQRQTKELKVLISADMEGIGGVVTWDVQAHAGQREYEEFRRLMTEEVNAAVAGAYDAGATYVLVTDAHGDHQNIDVNLLDPRAELIRGKPEPLGMMQGIDSSFGAVVFVGYHAAEGTADAVLSHTFTGRVAVSLNGKAVSEGGFNAAIAADLGVPVVFVSGDQTVCAQLKAMLGPIETVAVKEALGFQSAKTIAPSKSQALIRAGVKRAVERRGEIPPVRLAHPVKVELQYNAAMDAEVVSYLPSVTRVDGKTVAFSGRDMNEVSRFVRAVLLMKP